MLTNHQEEFVEANHAPLHAPPPPSRQLTGIPARVEFTGEDARGARVHAYAAKAATTTARSPSSRRMPSQHAC